MRRGELTTQGMPILHVDWRVLVDEADGGWLWKLLFVPVGRFPRLVAWLRWWIPMSVKAKAFDTVSERIRLANQWLRRENKWFRVVLVVVGRPEVADYLPWRVDDPDRQLSCSNVEVFDTWSDYAEFARRERPVELVIRDGAAVTGVPLSGVRVRAYTGWGHRPGVGP